MKRRDEVVFIRESGKYEKMIKADFYEMLGVNEIELCQDNLGLDELNKIHGNVRIEDLSQDSVSEFLVNLGVQFHLDSILSDIKHDGCWEAFNDGYNTIVYSSVRFVNYKDIVFASEVYDNDDFSYADSDLFNYICENKISGIKEIYIKNWW